MQVQKIYQDNKMVFSEESEAISDTFIDMVSTSTLQRSWAEKSRPRNRLDNTGFANHLDICEWVSTRARLTQTAAHEPVVFSTPL